METTYSSDRAELIYFEEFYGEITLNDFRVKNTIGMVSAKDAIS